MKRIRLWDLPTRLFHWSLVILMSVSLYTGFTGGFVEMDYHMLSGYSILGLIVFRIVWGFVGSHYARFATFVRGPGAILAHGRELLQRGEQSAGHNALGALSILALLVVLLFQATTGLFTNDDIMLEGPLAQLISYDLSRTLTGLHKQNAWLIVALIALHVSAIAFYEIWRRDRLVLPMITGRKQLPGAAEAPVRPGREIATALVIGAVCAGGVYAVVNFA